MWNSRQNRIVLVVSAVILAGLFIYALGRDTATIVPLQKVKELIRDKQVSRVIACDDYLYFKTPEQSYKIALSQVDPGLLSGYAVTVSSGSRPLLLGLFGLVVLLGGAGGVYWYRLRAAEPAEPAVRSAGRGAAAVSPQKISAVRSDVTFNDIGGIKDVKMELEEIIDFLRNPKRYRSFGARMPRGVLLVGPPGVGKTMIAKAVAAEANVPFYYQSGASFVQIYVGMGAKRVQELFSAAKSNAPSIIFIDEIDAVGKKRDGSRNDEREATLNQLLTEMDGFEDTSGVIVIAATNKIDVLDSALLRAGRFDRRVFVELPTPREREAILSKYLAHVPNNVSVEAIARMTVGFNGAALAALVNEAALLSLRRNDLRVTMEHVEQVKDKVLFGKKKIPVLTDEQKEFRARYQAGKAYIAQHYDLPFDKVVLTNEMIRPAGIEPMLKHEMEQCVRVLLAGTAACELKFNEHGTNAAEDIAQARELVDEMVDKYAMGASIVPDPSQKSETFKRLYSETKALLEGNDHVLESIASVLLERESISKEGVVKIVDEIF